MTAAVQLGTAPAVAAPSPLAHARRPTLGGWLLLLLGLSLFGSAVPEARPRLGGLSVHPYLPVLLVAALPALLGRPDPAVHRGFSGAGLGILLGVVLSFLINGDLGHAPGTLVKFATVGLTFEVTARLVRNEADVRWGIYGLVTGVALIALRGLVLYRLEPRYYINVMQGIGSRNAYSLWTIAPIALCMWFIASPALGRRMKALPVIGMVLIAVPQVLSLSRSGWLMIVATVGGVLALRRSGRAVIAVVVLGLAVQAGVESFGFADKMQSRMEDLRSGTESDSVRGSLVLEGLSIFAHHPLFGVSGHRLEQELGRALRQGPTDSHNLYVDLLAGFGLVTTLPLLLCVLMMLHRGWLAASWGRGRGAEYAGVLPLMVVLVAMRGMTANEILYNPSVTIGLALVFAAANLAIAERRRRAAALTAGRRRARLDALAGRPGSDPGEDTWDATSSPSTPDTTPAR